MMTGKTEILARSVRRIVHETPGRMGVSVRLVGHGSVCEINSRETYPLASVYKVPILATAFHKVSKGDLSLDKTYTLREADKSLGSGDLQYFRSGMRLSLHDLCYLMIVHSDNTATDMIHHAVGFDTPTQYMLSLGLGSIDVHCPNREYFLIFLGWGERFKGMSLWEIARVWKRMSRAERIDAFMEIREQTKHRTAREAQKRGSELWGSPVEKETREIRVATAVMDNPGSPSDIAKLLELIVTNKIAPKRLTEQMLEYMLLCDARDRLPSKIPENVKVANKTGGVPGTVNDCAVIFASKRNTVTCACLTKDVEKAKRCETEDAIARIGLAAYNAFKA